MTWIDIAVTVLLTLRIALSRPGLPRLRDKKENTRPGRGEANKGSGFWMRVVTNLLHSHKSPDATWRIAQLHIHVMPDSRVRR